MNPTQQVVQYRKHSFSSLEELAILVPTKDLRDEMAWGKTIKALILSQGSCVYTSVDGTYLIWAVLCI